MKIINKLIKGKFFKLYFIPGVLLIVWVSLSIVLVHKIDGNFSVISETRNKVHIINYQNTKLEQGDTLKGEFTAKDNYLGILILPIRTFERVDFDKEDTLVFKIKQLGSKKWYYQNT